MGAPAYVCTYMDQCVNLFTGYVIRMLMISLKFQDASLSV